MKKLINARYLVFLLLLLLLAGCPPFPVTILSPNNGAHFEVWEEITFTGAAQDFQDGELTGGSLVWTSSIDGKIGEGTTFTRDDLSEGKHKITLTAKNSQEEEGTATITITIGEGTSTTTTTPTEISGELEIDKIIGPLGVPMEAELMIPFHVEGTKIVAEGGPWMTPISGDDVPDSFGCTVDYTGEFDIRNVGGKLVTTDPNNPFLYFTFEVYETEYWTRTCPDGVYSGEWVSGWWESDCGMDPVDGYTWGGPPTKFLYTLHLDATP